MAGYILVATESTVQVLAPTVVHDVVYCTIQTTPSGVVASYPVRAVDFQGGYSVQVLTDFATGIEYVMSQDHVVSGIGSQQIDDNGLLVDSVLFTVEYVDPAHPENHLTLEAPVPAADLYAVPQELERGSAVTALDPIVTAYDALKLNAGG